MIVYMVMLTMGTCLRIDKRFTDITIDILIEDLDIDIDTFTLIKDRAEYILIIVEPQSPMIFTDKELITSIVCGK